MRRDGHGYVLREWVTPEFIQKLLAENILYGRDDRGEFLKLYSPSYGEGLFFEVVEQQNGYAGYGATNAIFRIAAQRRSLLPRGRAMR